MNDEEKDPIDEERGVDDAVLDEIGEGAAEDDGLDEPLSDDEEEEDDDDFDSFDDEDEV